MAEESSDSEVTPVQMTIICRTEGCPENGVPYTTVMYPRPTPPIWMAMCHGCETTVTDVAPVAG
ncbi:hypothetical protein LUR56_40230 [Streptomyces sp. MT29]|nr:hypothetical protein [Streptomyces sp. MT29]